MKYAHLSICKEIAVKVTELEIGQGKQPQTLAGAAIFFFTLMNDMANPSCFEIANSVDLAEQTIRGGFREMIDHLDELVPKFYKPIKSIEDIKRGYY
jgi:transcription initiation factor TFIIIB Brf1 subunit/transcription initiation factor TFIIB